MQDRRFYAAFAGIDAYPDSPLSGCIQDVLKMDRFFREQCAAQEGLSYHPAYYLQPNTADLRLLEQYGKAAGAPLTWHPATFDNITQRLFRHFEGAKKGDICVFFYSGHGSQTAAPPEFHHNNPSRKLQTLVCADSRTTARDLTSKELAYLLWEAFGKTEAHCLVITDCCHSGGNTRALAPQSPAHETRPPFQPEDSNPHAPTPQSPANEFRPRFRPDGGRALAFTDLLGHGAPGFYREENGEMKPAIARYVHLAACRADELAQESWRGGIFTGRLTEALRANGGAASYRDLLWRLQTVVNTAASQQHPVAFAANDADLDRKFLSDALAPIVPRYEVLYDNSLRRWKIFGGTLHGLAPGAVLDIRDGDIRTEAELREVEPLYSLADLPELDTASETARATLLRAAAPQLRIASAPDAALEAALRAKAHPLLDVRFRDGADAGYEIFRPADGSYILLEKNGTLPLFRRTADAAMFAEYAQRMAAWMAARDWKHLDPRLTRDHFEWKWFAVEGGEAPRELPEGNDHIELRYRNGISPAFRLSIALKADAPVDKCFVRVLFLGSKFDIYTELIRNGEPALERGGPPLHLTYVDEGRTDSTIPVSIDEAYLAYNRYQISDHLKIIASTADFTVDRFAQEALELDQPGRRGLGRQPSGGSENPGERPVWSVFNARITTLFDGLEKAAGPNENLRLGPLEVTTPAGFAGKLSLLPEWKVKPDDPSAWGLHPSENALDGGMGALLSEVTEAAHPVYIVQPAPRAAVRPLPDHVIIPYVADKEAYRPVGFQDALGRIVITAVASSEIRFRRIFLPRKQAGVSIHARINGEWRQVPAFDPAKSAALLLDGIIGDSEYMWRVFSALPGAPEQLLRYDFTLTANLDVTAEALRDALDTAGADKVKVITNGIGKQLVQLTERTTADMLIFTGNEGDGQTSGGLLQMLAFAMRESGPVKSAIPGLAAALRLHREHLPATVPEGKYPAYLQDPTILHQILPH